MIFDDLKNFFLKTYWINSKINNGKRLYFNKIFIPDFIKSLNNHFQLSTYFDLEHAASKSSVKGLLDSIFDPNEKYFDALDLAVAINISINGYCNEKYVNNHKIVDLANYICEELKARLYQDKFLREYLVDLNRDLNNFNYSVKRESIDLVLRDKVLIFKTYFNRFNKQGYSSGIRVFHEAKDGSGIDWLEENSITIHHDLVRFNKGFFLTGFDYQLTTGERLRIASSERGYEYFNPEKYDWPKGVVWAA